MEYLSIYIRLFWFASVLLHLTVYWGITKYIDKVHKRLNRELILINLRLDTIESKLPKTPRIVNTAEDQEFINEFINNVKQLKTNDDTNERIPS